MHLPEPDEQTIAATRSSLQVVAEHLLSADLHRHTGRIGLRQTPGGFGTPTFIVGGVTRQLRVAASGLVVRHGDERHLFPLTTIGELAEESGIVAGAPADVYSPTTTLDLDAPLTADHPAIDHLAVFLRHSAEALERLVADHPDDEATSPQLWPEHFDFALSFGEVNYGACLGDSSHDLPYLYVGPFAARTGEFWTEPFGAALTWTSDVTTDDMVAFFAAGHAHALTDSVAAT